MPRGELARDLEVVAGRIVEGHDDALRLRPGELDRERSAVRQRVEQHAEALAADVVSALGSFDDTVERQDAGSPPQLRPGHEAASPSSASPRLRTSATPGNPARGAVPSVCSR